MEWKVYEELYQAEFEKKKTWLENEYSKIKTGRANPTILDTVRVNYYDTPTKIIEIANINVSDARTIQIKPYEKNMVQEISKAITSANLGFNPLVDADSLRIIFPAPTEESRKETVKKIKEVLENAKVQVRNARQDILKKIKTDETLREDELKGFEKKVDELTKKYTTALEEIFSKKEKELMTI